jgi:hypothetical protein
MPGSRRFVKPWDSPTRELRRGGGGPPPAASLGRCLDLLRNTGQAMPEQCTTPAMAESQRVAGEEADRRAERLAEERW